MNIIYSFILEFISQLNKGCPLQTLIDSIKQEENTEKVYVITHFFFQEISDRSLFGALAPRHSVRRIRKEEMSEQPIKIRINCDACFFDTSKINRTNFNLRHNNSQIFLEKGFRKFLFQNFEKFRRIRRLQEPCLENANFKYVIPNETKIALGGKLNTNRLFMTLHEQKKPCQSLTKMVLRPIWQKNFSENIPDYLKAESPQLTCHDILCKNCSGLIKQARSLT